MGEHGHVIDNIVQATVVIADGSILTASEHENADLFWAVRGGGSNFGVVTEFVLKMHPQRPTVFCGTLVFPPPMVNTVMKATQDWYQAGADPKTCVLFGLGLTPDGHVRSPSPPILAIRPDAPLSPLFSLQSFIMARKPRGENTSNGCTNWVRGTFVCSEFC